MAYGPITSWQIDGKTMETVKDFISWAPKSLQMVTAAGEALASAGSNWQTHSQIPSTISQQQRGTEWSLDESERRE